MDRDTDGAAVACKTHADCPGVGQRAQLQLSAGPS